ncbi:MAG: DUF4147 domain-containing protein, partial [Candidatus Bathyarchaeota archaeon]
MALTILESALEAVNPIKIIKEKIRVKGSILSVNESAKKLSIDLDNYNQILVIGGGKACGGMAEALEEVLGDRISSGILNIPRGMANKFRLKRIELNEAGHPLPDVDGLNGVEKILKLLRGADEKTLVITLLSGGGSALLPFPQKGISLEDTQKVTNLLLKCGANIEEINIVRKHISGINGGRLSILCYPATLLCLILSDVVGDSLTNIASGPTAPDPSTYTEAIEILKLHNIWEKTPETVRKYLNNGLKNKNRESPKPGDFRFSTVHNIILGNNWMALEAAEGKAMELGVNSLILSSYLEGEAQHVGTILAAIIREICTTDNPIHRPGILLAGGETTVTVKGLGKGGRNQELALSAAIRLTNLEGVALAAIGTDGLDGPTDAAGAIVDGSTLKRA